MKKKSNYTFIVLLVFFIVIAVFSLIHFISSENSHIATNASDSFLLAENLSCVRAYNDTVFGVSMTGIVENGANVTVLAGYYHCNPLKRGDIIVYNYSGNKNPLIKIVKGIAGDSFSLQKTTGGAILLINNISQKTSTGSPYLLDDGRYQLLQLYVRDFAGVIPKNSALILGNNPAGTIDSSYFGLVSVNDIIGKALVN